MEIYVVFLIAFLLTLWAEKTNKKIGMFLAIIVLSVFVGFRDKSIGDDTGTYYQFLILLERGIYSVNVEKGFLLFSNFFLKIFGSIPAVFFIYSFITNACVLLRLWTLRHLAPFSQMCLLYLLLIYPETCNIVRQTMIVSIIFLATLLIEKKKYVSFLLVVSACFLIHRTSIVALLLIPLFVFFSNSVTKTARRKLLICCIIMAPVLIFLTLKVFDVYSAYFSNKNNSFGFMNPVKLAAWILSSFLFCNDLFIKTKANNISDESFYFQNNRFIMVCYAIGILLAFLGYLNTTLVRVGLYFSIFEIIYIPLVCYRSKRGKEVVKLMYFVILTYIAITTAMSGWSELGNYISVFAK